MFHISHRQSSRLRRSSTPRKLVTALIMFFFCSTSRGWPSHQHQPPYPWRRAIGAEVRGAKPSAPRPSYHSFGRPITYRHHHLAKDHHYHLAESSAPRQYKSPPPFGRAVSADANTM